MAISFGGGSSSESNNEVNVEVSADPIVNIAIDSEGFALGSIDAANQLGASIMESLMSFTSTLVFAAATGGILFVILRR